jgi:hypothetical protein
LVYRAKTESLGARRVPYREVYSLPEVFLPNIWWLKAWGYVSDDLFGLSFLAFFAVASIGISLP